MTLLLQAYLLERYGPHLDIQALAAETGLSTGTIRNQISQRRFPIPTRIVCGRRVADWRDVASWIDQVRAGSREDSPA